MTEIKNKLRERELIISPILDLESQIEKGSINIRLGTKFITTKKEAYGLIDPPHLSYSEIRKFQTKLYYSFGHEFILHPRQLVLAATFEFIKLPDNLCAYVLSRSRYGRAGLMVATATYVHPSWKGCLTLELFNYGDTPIKLQCGSPIAQLVIQSAMKIDEPYNKEGPEHIPTGPEFVSMNKDKDWDKLSIFRDAPRSSGAE